MPEFKETAGYKMKGFSGFGNSPMTKKSPAKGRETWSTEDDRAQTATHNKKHADGKWNEDHQTQQDIDKAKASKTGGYGKKGKPITDAEGNIIKD